MARSGRITKKRLGELLVEDSICDAEQVREALLYQKKAKCMLVQALVEHLGVAEKDIARSIVRHYGWPYLNVGQYHIDDEVLELFPERMLREYQFIPLDKIGEVIIIATMTILNYDIINELERMTACQISIFVGTFAEVTKAIDVNYRESAKRQDQLTSLGSLLLEPE